MRGRALTKLRNWWAERATENATYFIAAEREDWSEQDFLTSGDNDIAAIANRVLHYVPNPPRGFHCLDIGRGLGRRSRALANRFATVHGIDISPEMVEWAKKFAPPVPDNVQFRVYDGFRKIPLDDSTIDFVFFVPLVPARPQQVDNHEIPGRGQTGTPTGRGALLQVNTATRPPSERVEMRTVPSEKVPIIKRKPRVRLHPHNLMGVVISAHRCRQLVDNSGMKLVSMKGAGAQYTWVLLTGA